MSSSKHLSFEDLKVLCDPYFSLSDKSPKTFQTIRSLLMFLWFILTMRCDSAYSMSSYMAHPCLGLVLYTY